MSLKSQSILAFSWSAADLLLRQGIQVATSIVLARLLAPEDFGTIALLYLFVGLGSLFIDGYFNAALVQRQDITHRDESTVFWFNVIAGAIVALALCAAAPAIAAFYGVPVLRPLTYALALNLSVGAASAVPGSLLSKALDFRTPAKCSAVAAFSSGVVAISLAWNGAGAWAIAAQALSFSTIYGLLLWRWNPWRPAWCFDVASLRSLLRFSGYMWMGAVLDTIYTQVYSLIIGRKHGVRDLGFYSRAMGTQQIPANLLMGILGRVLFPTFSAAATDRALLVRGVRRVLVTVMLVNIPIMLGLMACAGSVIVTVFGAKWLPSAPLLEILCLVGLFMPLQAINTNALLAQGHSRFYFRIETVKKIIGVGLLLSATPFGIKAMAWSQVAGAVIGFVLNAHYTGVLLGYPAKRQVLDMVPFGAVAVLMAALVAIVSWTGIPPGPMMLAVQATLGFTTYVAACKLLKLEAFEAASRLVAERIRLMSGAPGLSEGFSKVQP